MIKRAVVATGIFAASAMVAATMTFAQTATPSPSAAPTTSTITVIEDNGKKDTFAVSQVARYPYDQFPVKEVFAATDIPMLNLITCDGTWDHTSKNYSARLVVYSKLVSQN